MHRSNLVEKSEGRPRRRDRVWVFVVYLTTLFQYLRLYSVDDRVWGCGLDSSGSGQGPVARCCERGNGLRIQQKTGNFLTI
jgi:hypothetical protein